MKMMRRVRYEYDITTESWRHMDDVHAALGPEYWEQYDDDDDITVVIEEVNWQRECFDWGDEGMTIRRTNAVNCASARAALYAAMEAAVGFEVVALRP